jgi:carboxyl-terminal processing protease
MLTVLSGWRWVGLAAGLLLPALPAIAAEPRGAVAPEKWPDLRDRTFATVWTTVNEAYYDATFGGVDWVAVKEKYRARLPEVADNEALRRLLQAMLGELRRTHFAIMPRETAVFTPAERVRIGTTGVELAYVEGMAAVSALKHGSAGARAGLHPGDVILKIDKLELSPLTGYLKAAGFSPARLGLFLTQLVSDRLRSAVGSIVELEVRALDGTERRVSVTCEANEGPWSEPMGDFPSMPVECTARHDASGIAYLHFNVFARPAMKDIKALLVSMSADGGLVFDLRGNLGGISVMAPGISGWLSDRVFLLGTMHLRQGHIGFTVTPQEKAFLGPVAVLIDSGSASTSEIMAAGLQEAGRVRVFGEDSPGAALPSLVKTLPTGDLLQYAIADLQTPGGVMIEGRGVVPDEPVKRTLADLATGRDPVLEAAQLWLEAKRRKGPALPPAARP